MEKVLSMWESFITTNVTATPRKLFKKVNLGALLENLILVESRDRTVDIAKEM